ncbi:MAG TPA: helix-turn-helix transcriptional regulator [Pseudomonadales bacterium]|nr:helix-turn-helix transcriptional regulator [Pseudomonadales bacterium]
MRVALEARKLRLSDLAAAVNVSRPAVSGWIRGEQLSVANLMSIAEYLQVSLNWLILDLGPMNIAADGELSATEENLIKIVRYFGSEAIRPTLELVKSLVMNKQQETVKNIKAYDLVSRTSIPIAVLDKKGHLVFSNIYHNQLLGLDDIRASTLIGAHFTEWVPKIFHRNFRSIIQNTLKNGFSDYSRVGIVCQETQEIRQIIVHSRAVRANDGIGVQLVLCSIDQHVS